jgi:hypothetical protein
MIATFIGPPLKESGNQNEGRSAQTPAAARWLNGGMRPSRWQQVQARGFVCFDLPHRIPRGRKCKIGEQAVYCVSICSIALDHAHVRSVSNARLRELQR